MIPLTVKIPEEDRQTLEEYCKENDMTMSQVVRKLIKDFLKNN